MAYEESRLTRWLASAPTAAFALYAIFASFSTYFCMYAFRKPFAAASYEGFDFWHLDLKTALVISQIIGYTLSKYLGIKVCSEVSRARRALTLVGLIAFAELALVMFAIVPNDWKVVAIFFNGLPLGMVWGMVVGYLEGRQTSELLLAGLSCSFIVASGMVKDVGRWLMSTHGIVEAWMPAATGAIFLLPFLVSVWLLNKIPQPNEEDIEARVEREPMNGRERAAFVRQFAIGLVLLLIAYTRVPGTAVFAIYLADAIGYTGSVLMQLYKDLGQSDISRLAFFKGLTYFMSVFAAVLLIGSCVHLLRRRRRVDRALERIEEEGPLAAEAVPARSNR